MKTDAEATWIGATVLTSLVLAIVYTATSHPGTFNTLLRNIGALQDGTPKRTPKDVMDSTKYAGDKYNADIMQRVLSSSIHHLNATGDSCFMASRVLQVHHRRTGDKSGEFDIDVMLYDKVSTGTSARRISATYTNNGAEVEVAYCKRISLRPDTNAFFPGSLSGAAGEGRGLRGSAEMLQAEMDVPVGAEDGVDATRPRVGRGKYVVVEENTGTFLPPASKNGEQQPAAFAKTDYKAMGAILDAEKGGEDFSQPFNDMYQHRTSIDAYLYRQ